MIHSGTLYSEKKLTEILWKFSVLHDEVYLRWDLVSKLIVNLKDNKHDKSLPLHNNLNSTLFLIFR